MENIDDLVGDVANDLVGDVAKKLMAQAEAMENPAMKERAKQVARSVSARERDELAAAARNAPFSRESDWMGWLGLTYREQKVLGRIYSFQCTKNRDGSQAEFRMSMTSGGKSMRIDRSNLCTMLNKLTDLGYVTKRENGKGRPATYLVDEVVCMTEARRNGYPG